MKLLILIVLLFGCGIKAVVPLVPIKSRAPILLPVLVTTPIREMDLLHQGLRDSTVALINITEVDGEKSAGSYCTGVWVGLDEILTAFHCVKDEQQPKKSPVGDEVTYVVKGEIEPSNWVNYHRGVVIAVDDLHDLALIRVGFGAPQHQVALLAYGLPAEGETVYSVGHPNKLYWSFMEGEVSAYRRDSALGEVIQVNMSIWYGHSGGGLFDYEGKLIGICAQKLGVPDMGSFVHLDNIRKFLDLAHLRAK